MSTPAELLLAYRPGAPCPCGYEGCTGSKLSTKTLHVARVCICPSCRNRRNVKKGKRAQSAVLKDAARAQGQEMRIAPTHEEQARLLVHYESKQGEQIPKGMRGDRMRQWENQARGFAERQTPRRKWALVMTMPGGGRRIWMDYEQFLTLVSEIQELP